MSPTGPNPSGLCMCGCGKATPIATRTRLSDTGQPFAVKGTPNSFATGHNARRLPPDAPRPPRERQPRPPRETKPLPDVELLLEEWEHFGETLGRPPAEFCKIMGGLTVDSVRYAFTRKRPNDPRARSFLAALERGVARRAALNTGGWSTKGAADRRDAVA